MPPPPRRWLEPTSQGMMQPTHSLPPTLPQPYLYNMVDVAAILTRNKFQHDLEAVVVRDRDSGKNQTETKLVTRMAEMIMVNKLLHTDFSLVTGHYRTYV